MKKRTPVNIASENSLRINQTKNIHWLEISCNAVLSFQSKIRKAGDRSFNAWLFLEREFSKYYAKNNIAAKPPKASTISQWFDGDPVTGVKLGAENLQLICKFVNDPTPVIAYYEQTMKMFDEEEIQFRVDLKKLEEQIIYMSKLDGDIASEYLRDLRDGKLSKDEAERMINIATQTRDHSNALIRTLKKRVA